jgi:hypothetical protein
MRENKNEKMNMTWARDNMQVCKFMGEREQTLRERESKFMYGMVYVWKALLCNIK